MTNIDVESVLIDMDNYNGVFDGYIMKNHVKEIIRKHTDQMVEQPVSGGDVNPSNSTPLKQPSKPAMTKSELVRVALAHLSQFNLEDIGGAGYADETITALEQTGVLNVRKDV